MNQEPEFDGRHAVANEHTVILSIAYFHVLELPVSLLIRPGYVCITNTYGNATVLKHPVNEFSISSYD